MGEEQATSVPTLRIERRFAAPPERVFDAWVTPETLSRWFGPSEDYTADVTALETRVGGRYRFVMRHKGGATHTAYGVYQTFDRPNRLVFSFAWEEDPKHGDMRVSLVFERDGAGTRMVLVQDRFVDGESMTNHWKGWIACFDRLQTRL